MEKIKKTFHEQIAENLIEQLKKGTAPWQKPWQPGDPLLTLPNNPTTGKNYKGINVLQLMCQGRTDPRWLTYKQAVNFGAQVRKGEKSTLVQHWKFADERIKKDDNGNPVLDSEGKQIKEQVKLERPRVFYASVFNAEQIDNLPKLDIKAPDWEPLDRAEQILQQSNAVIHHGENDRAFYRASTDSIHLPHKHQFSASEHYYATALHELGHWSGSETRLNRDLSHPFGSEGYAKEELRAEIASMLLGGNWALGMIQNNMLLMWVHGSRYWKKTRKRFLERRLMLKKSRIMYYHSHSNRKLLIRRKSRWIRPASRIMMQTHVNTYLFLMQKKIWRKLPVLAGITRPKPGM